MALVILLCISFAMIFYIIYLYEFKTPVVTNKSWFRLYDAECFYFRGGLVCCMPEPLLMAINHSAPNPVWISMTECVRYEETQKD